MCASNIFIFEIFLSVKIQLVGKTDQLNLFFLLGHFIIKAKNIASNIKNKLNNYSYYAIIVAYKIFSIGGEQCENLKFT